MYEPRIREKQPEKELGGVILHFAGDRFEEARVKAGNFLESPLQWIRQNQPIRKALLLEGLDLLRPGIEVEHEHKIEKWKKPR